MASFGKVVDFYTFYLLQIFLNNHMQKIFCYALNLEQTVKLTQEQLWIH